MRSELDAVDVDEAPGVLRIGGQPGGEQGRRQHDRREHEPGDREWVAREALERASHGAPRNPRTYSGGPHDTPPCRIRGSTQAIKASISAFTTTKRTVMTMTVAIIAFRSLFRIAFTP